VRVVAALGGNALLRRGQPLTAANQRANAHVACAALAPLALEHELVISHGNGPQVGLLALQNSAYTAVEPYPLDLLGAQTEGMIGYLIQQELGNLLPPDRRLASLLTQIEVAADDPAFGNPTKPIGPRRPARWPSSTAGRSGRMATATGASCRPRCRGGSSASSRCGGCSTGAASWCARAAAASRSCTRTSRRRPVARWSAWRR
jgi:carbamate kinase